MSDVEVHYVWKEKICTIDEMGIKEESHRVCLECNKKEQTPCSECPMTKFINILKKEYM